MREKKMDFKKAREHLEKAYTLASNIHVSGLDVDYLAGARAEMKMAYAEIKEAENGEKEVKDDG